MKRRDDGVGIGTTLEKIADKVVESALAGDKDAVREIAERHDGKVAQAIVGDGDAPPVNMKLIIENIIVDPKETSSEGVPPSADAE